MKHVRADLMAALKDEVREMVDAKTEVSKRLRETQERCDNLTGELTTLRHALAGLEDQVMQLETAAATCHAADGEWRWHLLLSSI